MRINKVFSKRIANHYLIGLDDQGGTGEVFQEEQINKFCLLLDFSLTIELYFSSNLLLAYLCTVNVPPSVDQLTSNIINIYECDVIMVPIYCRSQEVAFAP